MLKRSQSNSSASAPPPSVASSSVKSGRRPKLGGADGDGALGADEQGLLEHRSSIEAGVFGVLFTLSKENCERIVRVRWVLIKVLLDAWQLFTTVINPDYGWNIQPNGTAWKVVSVLNFTWLQDLGYTWYLVLLYGAIVLLAINLALCVWVAWSFKEQKFDYLWPIKFLRFFTSVFFQAFDVASLNLLQLGISCMYTGPQGPHLHMQLFPAQSCSYMPQLAHAVVSGLALVIFIAIALLLNMAEVEVNPTSKRPIALGHSGAEVAAFAIKALLTLVGVFLGWPRVASVAYLVLSLALAWQYFRWSPNLVAWVNWLKSGVAGAITYCALLQTVMVFAYQDLKYGHADERTNTITLVMLIGLLPAFLVSALASRWLLDRETKAALKAFRTVDPVLKPQDIYPFGDPRDVEKVARTCRVWVDHYTLDKEAVARAEEVIKAGLVIFPSHAFMALVYANFMMDVLGVSQSGSRQLENARKLSPSLMCRFMLFVRQQQATQKAAGTTSGGTGSMDLLGYVEYQRKQRMVVGHHKEALQAMANFWKILDASSVSFTTLSKALAAIEKSVSQAETAYRVVLEAYGSSPRLVRLYAKFLEGIKNDPWGAAEYNAEADRLEEAKDGDGQGPMLPDGTPLSRMDDLPTAVIVTNAFGEVQMANRGAHTLFGYRKGELEGKNVSVLMPPHISQRHTGYFRRYIEAGSSAPTAFKRTVLGLHRERVAFPLRLSVTRSSGMGEDAIFIGLLEPLPASRGSCSLWVAQGGIIACCDPSFVAMSGHLPEDVIGSRLDTLLQDDKSAPVPAEVRALGRIAAAGKGSVSSVAGAAAAAAAIEAAPEHDGPEDSALVRGGSVIEADGSVYLSGDAQDGDSLVDRLLCVATASAKGAIGSSALAPRCLVVHKYDSPLLCSATATTLEAGNTPLFEVKISMLSREPQLLMVVGRKGGVKHMSADLAALLGVAAGGSGIMAPGGGPGGARHGGGGGGGAAGAPAGPDAGGAAGVSASMLSGFAIQDFIPGHLRDMSIRYFKDMGGVSSSSRAQLSEAALAPPAAGSGPAAGPLGPTLELLSTRGKPVHVRAAVAPLELSGERLEVIRMAPSSLEEGLAARRLGLRVSPEGVITAVDGPAERPAGQPELLGLAPKALVGRQLWDVVTMTPLSAAAAAVAEEEVLAAKDDLAHSLAAATGSSEAIAASRAARDIFNALVRRSLESPGESWRVAVAPPGAAAKVAAVAGGDRKLAASLLARRSSAAVMQVLVSAAADMPAGSGAQQGDGDGEDTQLNIRINLWAAEGMTAVVQLDALGRVSKAFDERLRPVGLLFGLPQADIMGEPLASLVQLAPGSKSPSDLLSEGPAKKSAMKSKGKDKDANTVGPLHKLQASHRDGAPLTLQVQAIGKLGRGAQPLVALLRVHNPQLPRPDALAAALAGKVLPGLPLTNAPDPAAAAARATSPPGKPSAMLNLALPPPPPPPPPPALTLGGGLLPQPGIARLQAAQLRGKAGSMKKSASGTALAAAAVPASPRPGTELQGKRSDSPTLDEHLEALMDDLAAQGMGTQQQDGGRGAGEKEGAAGPKPGTPRAGGSQAAAGTPRAAAHLGGEQGVRAGAAASAKPARPSTPPPPGTVPRPDTARSSGSGGDGGGSAACSFSDRDAADDNDEEDGVEALGPAKHDRISDWVASKGERYQNQSTTEAARHAASSPQALAPAGRTLTRPMPSFAASAATGRNDDAASVGGESHMSGQSGYSAVSGVSSSGGVEYKRGKRFRKLVQLMDSPQAQQVLLRLKRHAWIIVGLLMAVHIVAFVLMTRSINNQHYSMVQLGISGYLQRHMLRAFTAVRALDVMARGRTQPNLYTLADMEHYAHDVDHHMDVVKDLHNQVLAGKANTNNSVYRGYYFNHVNSWIGFNTSNNNSDIMGNLTVWDMCTRIYTSGREVVQHYREWIANGTNIYMTVPGHYILRAGPDVYVPYRQILDALLQIAVDQTKHVNTLQLIFLVIEGAVICSIAAGYLVYLLRKVANQRYMLYETFLIIPLGLTRALASQNTNLLDEGDSDEEEEDDADKKLQEAPKAQRRAQLASIAGGKGDGDDDGGGDGDGGGGGGAASRAGSTTSRKRGSAALQYNMSGYLGGGMGGEGGSGRKPGVVGWFQGLGSRLRRRNSVQPFGGAASAPPASKRVLRRDNRDTLYMLAPFFIWSMLVITLYAIDCVKLDGVAEMVAQLSVTNFVAARTYRNVFHAHELAAEDNPAMLESRKATLAKVTKGLRDAWYTLLLGNDAYLTLGNATERFPRVKQNIAFESLHMEQLLHFNRDCLRLEEHKPCPGPDYRFYEVTRVGVDAMMQKYLYELTMMAQEVTNASYPGLANPRLDFIFNVGTQDLIDGVLQVGEEHLHKISSFFDAVLLLHIFLFVLMFVVFGFFLVAMLYPLLKRMRKEKRRIAELMSQLPLELDVEKLVAAALGTSNNNGSGPTAPERGNGGAGDAGGKFMKSPSMAGGTGMALAEDSETNQGAVSAVKQWKTILKQGSTNFASTK